MTNNNSIDVIYDYINHTLTESADEAEFARHVDALIVELTEIERSLFDLAMTPGSSHVHKAFKDTCFPCECLPNDASGLDGRILFTLQGSKFESSMSNIYIWKVDSKSPAFSACRDLLPTWADLWHSVNRSEFYSEFWDLHDTLTHAKGLGVTLVSEETLRLFSCGAKKRLALNALVDQVHFKLSDIYALEGVLMLINAYTLCNGRRGSSVDMQVLSRLKHSLTLLRYSDRSTRYARNFLQYAIGTIRQDPKPHSLDDYSILDHCHYFSCLLDGQSFWQEVINEGNNPRGIYHGQHHMNSLKALWRVRSNAARNLGLED